MSTTPAAGAYLIDSHFDADLANRLAHLESYNKHYYRPNTYLHKWWARRCGSTFRLILKHLSDDPQQSYYRAGGLEGRIILDPMMGGGTTLHEALRMGANVIGVDLEPIPILQARATLSDYPLARLEAAFSSLIKELRRELASYYETCCPHCGEACESWYVLYGTRRSCACGPVLVVDSLTLRQEPDGSALVICAACGQLNDAAIGCECGGASRPRIVAYGTGTCPDCSEVYGEDLSVPYYRRFTPLAITGHCPAHNLFFAAASAALQEKLAAADKVREELLLPQDAFVIEPGEKSIQLLRRGINNYLDLFSSRQLLILARSLELLPAFDKMQRLNLALLISTALEFNSMLCGYKGKGARRSGAIRHTFAYHAYTFPNTAVENNPLYPRRASGTWQRLFHMRIRRARRWASEPRERNLAEESATFLPIQGEVDAGEEALDYAALLNGQRRFLLRQGSATRLDLPDASVDSIITDPPYYDSVQYSDLAAFFRVWLQQFLPDEAEWRYDVGESAVDPHKNGRNSRYAELMGAIFAECARVLRRPHGRLIFTFHHWNPLAWAALSIGLQGAGFQLLNYAVVHAEHPISVHIANMKALTHDAILVFGLVGDSPPRPWQAPAGIDQHSSAAFCAGCAENLGWSLNAGQNEEDVRSQWQAVLLDRDEKSSTENGR